MSQQKMVDKLYVTVVGHVDKEAILRNLMSYWLKDNSILEAKDVTTLLEPFQFAFDLESGTLVSSMQEAKNAVILQFKESSSRSGSLTRLSYSGTHVFFLIFSVIRLHK